MFLKNKNIIFKIRRSKVTEYAALNVCSPLNAAEYLFKDISCFNIAFGLFSKLD